MIQLFQVTRRYQNGIEGLRDANLRLQTGEFAFISGRSGAGKTTLLNLIGARDVVTEGHIVVAGQNLQTMSPAKLPYLRRSISWIWQDFRLLSDRTVRRNVALPLEVLGLPTTHIDARVDQLLEQVGMRQYADSLPHWLSGGEQQRVAIARALIGEPTVILADEPTGNLDPDLGFEIIQMLREVQSRGTTVIVATHDRKLLEVFSERVILLNRGYIIDDGGAATAGPAAPIKRQEVRDRAGRAGRGERSKYPKTRSPGGVDNG